MADDEDYAKTRFQTAIPRGLQHMPGPTHMPSTGHMSQHTLGTVGEGRDKGVVTDNTPSPIVNGIPNASASSSGTKQVIIIDDDMVARYYTIAATLVGDVP